MVRGMQPENVDSVFCFPGADWDFLLSYVCQHLIEWKGSLVYILTGPVELAILDRSRREVALRQEYTYKALEARITQLKKYQIYVVVCTATPMHFYRYNSRCMNPLYADYYEEMTEYLTQSVIKLNQAITETNKRNNFATPFVHSFILKRMRGEYKFRHQYLDDGLHPGIDAIRHMESVISKNIPIAIQKIIEELDKFCQEKMLEHNII